MPLPKPAESESEREWIDRAMGDEVMLREFPDREQRFAVCRSLWERRGANAVPLRFAVGKAS